MRARVQQFLAMSTPRGSRCSQQPRRSSRPRHPRRTPALPSRRRISRGEREIRRGRRRRTPRHPGSKARTESPNLDAIFGDESDDQATSQGGDAVSSTPEAEPTGKKESPPSTGKPGTHRRSYTQNSAFSRLDRPTWKSRRRAQCSRLDWKVQPSHVRKVVRADGNSGYELTGRCRW